MSSECPNVLQMSDPEDAPHTANTEDSVVNTALFAHTYVDVVKKTPALGDADLVSIHTTSSTIQGS